MPEASFPLSWEDRAYRIKLCAVDIDGDGDQDLVVSPILPQGGLDWVTLPHDLRLGSLPRLGKPYRVRLRAGDAAGPVSAITGLSPTVPQPPLPIGTFGDLRLHPGSILLMPFAVVPDPDTTVELAITLPSPPQFLGMPSTAQSLFVPIDVARARISSAVSFLVEN